MPIPALDGVGEPLCEHLDSGRVLPMERSPLENALDGLGHGEPGARSGRPEQEDAMLGTPLHQTVALLPCQSVYDEQYAHQRGKTVQLLGHRRAVPVLPAAPFRNVHWCRGRRREHGFPCTREPGVQHGGGALLHGFCTNVSRGRANQGQPCGCPATEGLVGATRRIAFRLEGRTRLRETLRRTAFIVAPHLEPEPLGGDRHAH